MSTTNRVMIERTLHTIRMSVMTGDKDIPTTLKYPYLIDDALKYRSSLQHSTGVPSTQMVLIYVWHEGLCHSTCVLQLIVYPLTARNISVFDDKIVEESWLYVKVCVGGGK